MALRWFAIASINFDLVRAFNIGDQVPDSVVAAHPAETAGRVMQIDVPAQNPSTVLRPLLTSDRDTDGEREAFVPARLSDGNLRAAFATRSVINALDFGASPSSSAAANTLALQSAISAAVTGSLALVIPGGTYSVNGLTIPGRVLITGAGRDRTILSYVGAGTAIGSATPGTRLYDWHLSDLTVTTSTGAVGIDLDSVSVSSFRNLKVTGFSDSGVYIHSTVSGGAVYNRFNNVTAQNCGTGFKLRGISSNANVWQGCRGNVCGICWDLQDSNDNTIEACQAESSTTAFFLDSSIPGGSGWNRIRSSRIEHCTNGWIINSSAVWDTVIDALWIDGSTTNPITDNGTRTRRSADLMSARVANSVVALDTGWQFVASSFTLGSGSGVVQSATATPLYLRGNAANAASAVANWLGNGTTLSTAGARIAGFCRDTPVTHASPVSYVNADGSYEFASGVKLMEGAGSPESVAAAPPGSVYLRRDGTAGTSLYRKETGTGATGWVAATSGGSGGSALDDPPPVSGMWTALSGRPYSFTATTGGMSKDTWRFVPCRLTSATSFAGLTVETTVAASGGTAALIFALYNVGSDGRPSTLALDLSSRGSIDLTSALGVQQLTFAATQFPAGEFFLACAWTGTATTGPTVRTVASTHPRIIDAAPGVIGRSGYVYGASGATPPSAPVVSTTANAGVVHFGKLA